MWWTSIVVIVAKVFLQEEKNKTKQKTGIETKPKYPKLELDQNFHIYLNSIHIYISKITGSKPWTKQIREYIKILIIYTYKIIKYIYVHIYINYSK